MVLLVIFEQGSPTKSRALTVCTQSGGGGRGKFLSCMIVNY